MSAVTKRRLAVWTRIMAVMGAVTGVILAGGLSRRMGGGDKTLLDVRGRPMLSHVIARLTPQVVSLAINANGDPKRFAVFGVPVVADTVADHPGPLAGILAAMRWSAGARPDASHVATVSGDAPLFPTDLVARCVGTLDGGGRDIAMARSGGKLHPVIGLWPVALADDLESALREGVRKVLHWTDRHPVHEVDFAFLRTGPNVVDPFFNANTPSELEELDELLGAFDR